MIRRVTQDGSLWAAGAVAALVVAAAAVAVRAGAVLAIGPLAVVAGVGLAAAAFLAAPHVMTAAAVPLMVAVPTLKHFWLPEAGLLKDLLVVAAVGAAAFAAADRARRGERVPVDGAVLGLAGALLCLYLINPGGEHDLAWLHGTRLMAEPVALLVAGMALPQPGRTLRAGVASLLLTACAVAAVGLVQQWLGVERLVALGYEYGEMVRTVDGTLRSFGTLDDPFAYAALLGFGLAAAALWMRRSRLAAAAGILIAAGLAASLVRTSALVVPAIAGLWLLRGRQVALAACLLGAAVVAALTLLALPPDATTTRAVQVHSLEVTLNGRDQAWRAAAGSPREWPFGLGVGAVGTAAERAADGIGVSNGRLERTSVAVDSGYLATFADVGAVGLALLVALLARLVAMAARAARAGRDEGWLAVGLLAALMLDASTRSSFTGFPTAFVGLLLVGVALAAAREPEPTTPTATR